MTSWNITWSSNRQDKTSFCLAVSQQTVRQQPLMRMLSQHQFRHYLQPCIGLLQPKKWYEIIKQIMVQTDPNTQMSRGFRSSWSIDPSVHCKVKGWGSLQAYNCLLGPLSQPLNPTDGDRRIPKDIGWAWKQWIDLLPRQWRFTNWSKHCLPRLATLSRRNKSHNKQDEYCTKDWNLREASAEQVEQCYMRRLQEISCATVILIQSHEVSIWSITYPGRPSASYSNSGLPMQ